MRTRSFGGALLCATLLVAGCRGESSREAPIVPIRNMYDQPRYNMQEQSPYFADKRTMRPPVPGTIAREHEIDITYSRGLLEDESGYVLQIPTRAEQELGSWQALVWRGQERFGIYCTPCHGDTGAGNGIVVQRGMLAPPTFHQDRLRHAPDGQMFATITNGVRNMPPYASQITPTDRWAIVAYLRALQLKFAAPDQATAVAVQSQGNP
jgi:mono/diheme cytochrome c family protein